jgi:hypothetical protein
MKLFDHLKQLIKMRMTLRMKRINRRITITKRQQFVIVTLLCAFGLLLTQIVSTEFRFGTVFVLSVVTYILCAFVLREDLSGIEWFTLLSLPTLFTAAIAVFYFLLPVRWLTRIPVVVVYSVCMYALLLTENIYNVAANRTIALLRAAHTVGFLLTLVVFFLLSQTVLSIRSNAFVNTLGAGIVAFILTFQTLWSVVLEPAFDKRILSITIATACVIAQLAWILSFWPITTTIEALFLTTCLYAMAGMGQQYLQEKLYKKTVTEFLIVTAIISVIVIISTNWRGSF